mgnify:CR=1 FL=1
MDNLPHNGKMIFRIKNKQISRIINPSYKKKTLIMNILREFNNIPHNHRTQRNTGKDVTCKEKYNVKQNKKNLFYEHPEINFFL